MEFFFVFDEDEVVGEGVFFRRSGRGVEIGFLGFVKMLYSKIIWEFVWWIRRMLLIILIVIWEENIGRDFCNY